MRILIAIAALAMIPATAVAAEETATSEATPKPEKPKKICREAQASSTSRIGAAKVCRTAEQWDEIDARGGERRSSTRSVQSASPGSEN